MRYEIRPRAGVKLADVIRKINTRDLQIVGGQDTLLVQAPERKIDELRRSITDVADLIAA